MERAHIERTLRAHNENRTRAARELGISRATLINKIKEYQLDPQPLTLRRAGRVRRERGLDRSYPEPRRPMASALHTEE